ncbi:PepSY domain-containing protein [Candidatus Viridilinea mediisalina]|uniref:PepSY domain-containing protein n=1 Tax=Candidatus Viridilinea mediisalina TaxID=2024553 RepID=A0A2A6RGJ5_9CHLR|nr:PepSY domain-containing protein [Candidatus Viridilinea mediisalina]PDW02009.1 hypothetical protein CJ255_16195 [Candidatus Viridilinea mediisalina]
MNQRTMLVVAAGLTAFILIIAGALVGQWSQSSAQLLTTTLTPDVIADPTLVSEFQQREAAYQTAIAEANQQIEQANQQLTPPSNLETAPQTMPQSETVATTVPMTTAPTAEEAAAIALNYRGGGTVRKVELEEERGLLVYEVKFIDGGEVYVDANTGQVVYAKLSKEERP